MLKYTLVMGFFFRLEGTTRFLNAIEEVLGNAEYFLHCLN